MVIFILAVSRLNAFATQIQPVIDNAAEIDMVQINTALENFNVMMMEMKQFSVRMSLSARAGSWLIWALRILL